MNQASFGFDQTLGFGFEIGGMTTIVTLRGYSPNKSSGAEKCCYMSSNFYVPLRGRKHASGIVWQWHKPRLSRDRSLLGSMAFKTTVSSNLSD